MMSKVIRILLPVLSILLAASCAKKPALDLEKVSEASFEAWMEIHDDGAEKQASGIYVKKIKGPDQADSATPAEGDWVMINYTGKALGSGNVFVTRDGTVADIQGTFLYTTHYEPQYLEFNELNTVFIQAQFLALSQMRAGEVWRVYAPSRLAYKGVATAYSSGYQGQYSLPSNTPIVMDIELVRIISDPEAYESEIIQQYAQQQWGLLPADTLSNDFYLHRTVKSGNDPRINTDTVASVFYVARCLDGFVVDTNIEDTARRHKIYDASGSKSYAALDIDFSSSDTANYISGFTSLIKALDYGEQATAIFSSANGYGWYGNQSGNTVIQPYTPLIYDVFVSPIGGDGTSMFPYMPSGILKVTQDHPQCWITGYIVGVGNPDLGNCQFTGNYYTKTNILLGDNSGIESPDQVIAVELPDGSEIQRVLNLEDNIGNKGYRILLKGDVTYVLGAYGVSNVTYYIFK